MKEIQEAFKITEKFNKKINRFCAPLVTNFGLNHFYHGKLTTSGQWVGINMNQEWANCYFYDDYFHLDPILRHPDNYSNGVAFANNIDDVKSKKILSAAISKYRIHISLVILDKLVDGMEFFIFGLTTSNSLQSMKLYNEIPMIRVFIKRFKEEFRPLYLGLEELHIDMSSLIGPSFESLATSIFPERLDHQQFLEQIGMGIPQSLTAKEISVIKYLTKGLSAPKIAEELLISSRTVEHHLERIKDKFACMTKAELIQKLQELHLTGFIYT